MSKEMKGVMKKYLLIIIVAIASLLPSEMYATHLAGGDMTYECLGNDFYRVTMVIRNDCSEQNHHEEFDDPVAIGIFDKTGDKLDFLGRLGVLYLDFNGSDTLDTGVPSCAYDGDAVCIHEAVYTGDIYLPFRQRGYVLTYQRCCRNETIDNIVNPLETGTTQTICIEPEAQTSCNSSPAFGAFPPIVICADEELSFDASATDKDGDQLVYKLYQPLLGAAIDYPRPQPPWNPPYNATVEYAEGFSLDNMLGSGSPLSIDENTGLITATPSAEGQFLVGILVEEWRNGEKLSETLRDFEINVKVCKDYPRLNFDVTDNCAGLTIDVVNNTTNSVSHNWNFNHPSTDPIFLSSEENPGSFTYSTPGIYQVSLEVMDAAGNCTLTEIKEVRAFNSELTSSFVYNNGCCVDGSTILSLVSTAEEPSVDYDIESYEWSISLNGSDPFTLADQVANFVLSCSDDAVVTLTTTSTNGCTSSTSETIIINQDFGDVDGNVCDESISICSGQSGSIGSLNPDRTYAWSPDDPTLIDVSDPLNPIFTPQVTTVYTVNAMDENGAVSQGRVTVNVVDGFALVIDAVEGMECEELISVTALANRDDLTYEWALDADFSTIVSRENPANINVTTGENSLFVRATSPEGCQEIATEKLESVFNPSFNSDFTFTNGCCVDGKTILSLVSVSEDSDSYTYQVTINGGEVMTFNGRIANFEVNCADNIEATLVSTSAVGCAVTTSQPIVIDQDFGSKEGNICDVTIDICRGQVGSVGALNGSRTYSWDPSDPSLIDISDPLNPGFTPPVSTVYMVTATDENGGTSVGKVTVNVAESFDLGINPVAANMECENSVEFTAVSNRDDITYEWSLDPDFATISATGNPASVDLNSGPNNVHVRGTSPEGCEEIAVITYESKQIDYSSSVGTPPDGAPYNACVDDFTTVTITDLSPDQTLWINWDANEHIISDNLNTESINVAAIGDEASFTLEFTARNTDGCEERGSVDVIVNREISAVISGETESCDGTFALTGSSSAANATFEWSLDPDFATIEGTDALLNLDVSEDVTIYLRASADNGCQSEVVSQNLTTLFGISRVSEENITYCSSDPLTVSVSTKGDASVVWTDANGVELGTGTDLVIADPTLAASPITATATSNIPGCEAIESVNFNLMEFVAIVEPGIIPDFICPGEPFDINVVNTLGTDLEYTWSPGGATGEAVSLTLDGDTDVVVTYTNPASGCSSELIIPIDVQDTPIAITADPSTDIFLCDEVTLFADPSNYAGYAWSNGDSGSGITVAPTETTTYTVTVTDGITGCTNESSITINVEIPECDANTIFVPTGFSPNGDNSNDVLLVRSNAVKEMDFYIVNRWGEEVFRSDNLRAGWDGTLNGRELAPDVYAWCLNVVCSSGDEAHLVGNVTLIR